MTAYRTTLPRIGSHFPAKNTLPPLIFHYTSPTGLLGILQESTLRFTDRQFMNDVSEYIHIRKPFRIAMELLKEELKYPYLSEIASALFDHTRSTTERDATDESHYYLFCASVVPDSLGMWNHYVKDRNYQGYSVGFHVGCLLESFRELSLPGVSISHGRVIYKEDEQVDLLHHALREVDLEVSQISKDMESVLWDDRRFSSLAEEILKNRLEEYRLFFKDESFADEREYRLVLKIPQSAEEQMDRILTKGYTLKNGLFIPHFDLSFSKENALHSIKVAPMIEFQLAKIGLQRFLNDHHYPVDKIEITQSTIPIRF